MIQQYTHRDGIACLICNKRYERPATHVRQVHGMSARAYKEAYGLPVKRGICTPASRDATRTQTLKNGTIANLTTHGVSSRFIKGDKRAGRYERAQSEKDRLRAQLARAARTPWAPHVTITCARAECGKTKDIKASEHAKYCSRNCATIERNRARKKPIPKSENNTKVEVNMNQEVKT